MNTKNLDRSIIALMTNPKQTQRAQQTNHNSKQLHAKGTENARVQGNMQVLILSGGFLKQKELHHWVYGKHEYYSLSTHHRWVLVQIVLHWLWVRGVLRGNITAVYKPDVQFPLSYLRDNNKTKRKTVSNRLSVNSLQVRNHLHDVFKRTGWWWLWRIGNFFPNI